MVEDQVLQLIQGSIQLLVKIRLKPLMRLFNLR